MALPCRSWDVNKPSLTSRESSFLWTGGALPFDDPTLRDIEADLGPGDHLWISADDADAR